MFIDDSLRRLEDSCASYPQDYSTQTHVESFAGKDNAMSLACTSVEAIQFASVRLSVRNLKKTAHCLVVLATCLKVQEHKSRRSDRWSLASVWLDAKRGSRQQTKRDLKIDSR